MGPTEAPQKNFASLIFVRATPKAPDMVRRAKEALWKCSMKVAMPCYVQVDKGLDLLLKAA